MSDTPELLEPHKKALAEFINGTLWKVVKEHCLEHRKPEAPNVKDPSHIAAAKGHQCAGFEAAFRLIEALPFEHSHETESVWARPALAITED